MRLHVRDALYQDGGFCDIKSNLEGVETGDVRWFYKSICINTPECRRTIKPGKSELVGRMEDLDMDGLGVAIELPDHATHPI